MAEQAYSELTHDWPMAAIKAFHEGGLVGEGGKPFRFVFLSGDGADRSGKGMAMFSRVKVRRMKRKLYIAGILTYVFMQGRTEADLLAYSNASPDKLRSFMLRPAYFFPSDPADAQRLRSGFFRCTDPILGGLLRAVNLGIDAADLGRVAVAVAKGADGVVGEGEQQETFSNRLMISIAKRLNGTQ